MADKFVKKNIDQLTNDQSELFKIKETQKENQRETLISLVKHFIKNKCMFNKFSGN